MKPWQFNILFLVGVSGAVFLMLAPVFGLPIDVKDNPTAVTGIGTILAYVLTQRGKHVEDKDKNDEDGEE